MNLEWEIEDPTNIWGPNNICQKSVCVGVGGDAIAPLSDVPLGGGSLKKCFGKSKLLKNGGVSPLPKR